MGRNPRLTHTKRMQSPARQLLRSPTLSQQHTSSQPELTPSGAPILPISAVTTFTSRNWAFIGRCTSKSGIRPFTSKDGTSGRIASADMIDASGDIHLTFFSDVCYLPISYNPESVSHIFFY